MHSIFLSANSNLPAGRRYTGCTPTPAREMPHVPHLRAGLARSTRCMTISQYKLLFPLFSTLIMNHTIMTVTNSTHKRVLKSGVWAPSPAFMNDDESLGE